MYTLGMWKVKLGREAEFVKTWKDFAEWTSKNQMGASEAVLLRDVEQPQKFISFGPWRNKEAVQAWRKRPEFGEFVKQARELCEEMQPNMLKVAARVKGGEK